MRNAPLLLTFLLAGAVGLPAQERRARGPAGPEPADLVITDSAVLDVRTGRVHEGRTVVVADGRIRAVLEPGVSPPPGARSLDGRGRLVTPGLVDVHGHLAYVLGDSVSTGGGFITHLSPSPDSLEAYRRRYARAYLPHGVTTVRDAGSTEADLAILEEWMEGAPDFPDFLPSGGALVSPEEGRTTFPGHVVVEGPEAARAKVRAYHGLGYDQLKLYWRLRRPEFRAALEEGQRLGMAVTGHVDFHVLPFGRALDLGLRSFEHAYTVGVGAMSPEAYGRLWREDVPAVYGARRRGLFYLAMLEVFNQIGPESSAAQELIRRLAATGASVSTSLHIFAQHAGAAPFRVTTGTSFDDTEGLTPAQRERAGVGYAILEQYVRRMHESGVRLTLATDWLEPGRVALSEMLLLYRTGIPMAEVFRIATLNGAEALGRGGRIGAVEPGARANLVLFDRNPLEDPEALLGSKTVIKDGKLVEMAPEEASGV